MSNTKTTVYDFRDKDIDNTIYEANDFYILGHRLNKPIMESLILAQSERWRRA